MKRMRITWPKGSLTAVLDDTPTSRALFDALPLAASANTWGDEVYFGVPVRSTLEADAREVVEPGTVCFWVEGSALALPFGPTPVAKAGECRLVTRVNLLGKLECNPRMLASVRDGDDMRIEEV